MAYNYPYQPYGNQPYNYGQPTINFVPPVQQQMQVQPQQQAPQLAQAVPQNVNKIYVTSLEDALGRFANTNTITVYHLQDETAEIEVATDVFGKKSYKIRQLSDYTPKEMKKEQPSVYVTQEQFTAIESRLNALEKAVNGKNVSVEEQAENE